MYNQLNNVEKVAALKVLLSCVNKGYSTAELKSLERDCGYGKTTFISEDDLKDCKGRWNTGHTLKGLLSHTTETFDLTWLEPESKTTEMVSLGHDDLYKKVEKVVYKKGTRFVWYIDYKAVKNEIAYLIEGAKSDLRNKISCNESQIAYLNRETEKLRGQLYDLETRAF